MGQCCGTSNMFYTEDYICSIFKDDHLKLLYYNYNRLLNFIVKYRIQQEIRKKEIISEIIPKLYDHTNENKLKKYHSAFFNQFLSELDKNNNYYSVILYLYPFINHDDENIEKTLYDIFKFICPNLTKYMLVNILEKYITFYTFTLTKIVFENENENKMKEELEGLCKIYSKDNIKKYVNLIIEPIKRKFGNNEIVPLKDCIELFIPYQLGSFQNSRLLILNQAIDN